jgi:hypothetical protein
MKRTPPRETRAGWYQAFLPLGQTPAKTSAKSEPVRCDVGEDLGPVGEPAEPLTINIVPARPAGAAGNVKASSAQTGTVSAQDPRSCQANSNITAASIAAQRVAK